MTLLAELVRTIRVDCNDRIRSIQTQARLTRPKLCFRTLLLLPLATQKHQLRTAREQLSVTTQTLTRLNLGPHAIAAASTELLGERVEASGSVRLAATDPSPRRNIQRAQILLIEHHRARGKPIAQDLSLVYFGQAVVALHSYANEVELLILELLQRGKTALAQRPRYDAEMSRRLQGPLAVELAYFALNFIGLRSFILISNRYYVK